MTFPAPRSWDKVPQGPEMTLKDVQRQLEVTQNGWTSLKLFDSLWTLTKNPQKTIDWFTSAMSQVSKNMASLHHDKNFSELCFQRLTEHYKMKPSEAIKSLRKVFAQVGYTKDRQRILLSRLHSIFPASGHLILGPFEKADLEDGLSPSPQNLDRVSKDDIFEIAEQTHSFKKPSPGVRSRFSDVMLLKDPKVKSAKMFMSCRLQSSYNRKGYLYLYNTRQHTSGSITVWVNQVELNGQPIAVNSWNTLFEALPVDLIKGENQILIEYDYTYHFDMNASIGDAYGAALMGVDILSD
jgi:hypothetical protein